MLAAPSALPVQRASSCRVGQGGRVLRPEDPLAQGQHLGVVVPGGATRLDAVALGQQPPKLCLRQVGCPLKGDVQELGAAMSDSGSRFGKA